MYNIYHHISTCLIVTSIKHIPKLGFSHVHGRFQQGESTGKMLFFGITHDTHIKWRVYAWSWSSFSACLVATKCVFLYWYDEQHVLLFWPFVLTLCGYNNTNIVFCTGCLELKYVLYCMFSQVWIYQHCGHIYARIC